MVVIEMDLNEKAVISEIKSLFPDGDYHERHSITGPEAAQIITSITALIGVLSGSSVLVQYIKSKKVKIKVGNIEYEGRAEDMPEFLKKKMRNEKV